MSIVSIRAALQTKLNAMTPALGTAWENTPYTPVEGTPYQAAYVMPASPENPTMGDGFFRMVGIFQINLYYPLQAGTATAEARAELIKSTFERGTSMTSGSVTVVVNRTPGISQGRVDGNRWMTPIKIRWYADIFN
jgi:hypothetical protein